MLKNVACWLLALLFAAGPVPCVFADDDGDGDGEKKDEKVDIEEPSPIAELREEHYTQDTPPADPIDYLHSFRTWVKQHEQPPPRTDGDRQLYDIWKNVIQPRAKRMTRRIDTLMKRQYWLPETGAAVRVKPDHWSRFIREIAGLNSELMGAWRQIDRVQIRERQLVRPRTRYYGYVGYGYPVGRWRSALYGRRAVVSPWSRGELNSYWNTMNYYRRGWGWRMGVCHECLEYRREKQKQYKEKIAEKRRLVETTRDTLHQQMLSLQLLAAAMQAIEEHQLHEAAESLPPDHLLRAPAKEVLVALRDARLTAEQYSGDSSAKYGQLLRNWLRAYKAGGKLLEKEEERLADEAAAARRDGEDDDPEGDGR